MNSRAATKKDDKESSIALRYKKRKLWGDMIAGILDSFLASYTAGMLIFSLLVSFVTFFLRTYVFNNK